MSIGMVKIYGKESADLIAKEITEFPFDYYSLKIWEDRNGNIGLRFARTNEEYSSIFHSATKDFARTVKRTEKWDK